MASSHHFTPPPLGLSSFGAACVKLCGVPPPSLDRTTVAAVSSSLHTLSFDVNMNIKRQLYLYFRTQWAPSQRRSQFKHDHCRGADWAPQITTSFTRGRQRAHRHTEWGNLGPDRIGAQMVTKAPCVCRPHGRRGKAVRSSSFHKSSLSGNVVNFL